jgi:hypothetical protein
MTTNEFIEEAIKIHGNKYDYSLVEFKAKHNNVTIICPIHGKFEQWPKRHLLGGCRLCGINSRIEKLFINKDIFIERAAKIHGNTYNYDNVEYKSSTTKIDIKCNICTLLFKQTPASHLQKRGCPKCRFSQGEKRIEKFLKDHNIFFISQKIFKDLKGIRGGYLKFDFYVPEKNLCIEYDGEQHTDIKSKYWSETMVQNDTIKDLYCIKNKIKLLRISYLDKERIESIISSTLAIAPKP